jgi:hypothetical protein
MRPKELFSGEITSLPDEVRQPVQEAISGEELDRTYKDCANVYRQIKKCIGTQDPDVPGPMIRLGPSQAYNKRLGRREQVQASVNLYFLEGEAEAPGFTVVANFHMVGDEVSGYSHREEAFGTAFFQTDESLFPEFIKNPDTSSTFDWDPARYDIYAKQLYPMIYDAQATQRWIIESLCNGELNPGYVDRAIELFGSPTSI